VIVADASVLANAVGDDGPDGDACRRILGAAEAVATPDVADVEVLSVLRRMWLAGCMSDDRLQAAVDDLTDLPVTRWPIRILTGRAAAHRANLTAYDAAYVVLAEMLGAELVTGDRRLAEAPGLRCAVRVVR